MLGEVPSWRDGLRILEREVWKIELPCDSADAALGSLCHELEVEKPLIRQSLALLRSELEWIQTEVTNRRGKGDALLELDLERRVYNFEGLLARTAGRIEGLLDAVVGCDWGDSAKKVDAAPSQ